MSKFDDAAGDSGRELMKVAQGESEADLAIINGDIVNVYTGEVLTGDTILIKGAKIAYVGKYARRGIGTGTYIIDATGKVLIPGLIDGHTHMDYITSSYELARFAMKTGTTTIITETAELAFKLGYRGLLETLRSLNNQPVKFWFTIPPLVSNSPAAREHPLTISEIRRLLKRKDVLGMGEPYWGQAMAGDKQLLDFIEETLAAGKKVEGHTAGATGAKLQAYLDLGITSDHEPITPEEALARMRLGVSVMVRDGEIRQDLEAVSPLKDNKIDFRRLALCTDGVRPVQLVTQGWMDYVLQKAIDLGFPPVQAIQMATLNVAEHFNLDDFIGGIAPGRFADIIMIPDLTVVKPALVISNGRVVSRNGELAVQPRRHAYAKFTYQGLRLDRKFVAGDFSVPVNTSSRRVKARVIDQITNLVTREAVLELPVIGGQVHSDTGNDIIKAAAIEYQFTHGKTFTGFIRGLGLKKGAIATSTAWDCCSIVLVGVSEADMAAAVNRIVEMGGGMVISVDGKVLAEAALPVASILSTEPVEVLAEKFDRLQQVAMELGCNSPEVRTTVSTLTTAAIPYLRICEAGLFNLRSNSLVDLVVEHEPD